MVNFDNTCENSQCQTNRVKNVQKPKQDGLKRKLRQNIENFMVADLEIEMNAFCDEILCEIQTRRHRQQRKRLSEKLCDEIRKVMDQEHKIQR